MGGHESSMKATILPWNSSERIQQDAASCHVKMAILLQVQKLALSYTCHLTQAN